MKSIKSLKTFAMAMLITAPLLLSSCKTTQKPVVLTRDLNVKDTLIRHDVESIVLPQRNYVVFEKPCKENELEISNQTIESQGSSVKIAEVDNNLVVEVDIDSIVNSRLSEIDRKSVVEKVEVPVEVKVPVRNPINLRLVVAVVLLSIWTLRKPIIYVVRRFIIPIP